MSVRVMVGDCREQMRMLAPESVHCVVTSPPYWGLRDYGVDGQIGLERSPDDWLTTMVDVFREVRRVLRADGTAWVTLGDTYASSGGAGWQGKNGQRADRRFTATRDTVAMRVAHRRPPESVKPKDLIGVPWMFAFALRADGWWLRQDIIWAKPNPMPESIRDRCTKAHEYVFLLSKSERYYFDAEAIKEPVSGTAHSRGNGVNPKAKTIPPVTGWATGPGSHSSVEHNKPTERGARAKRPKQNASFSGAVSKLVDNRNKRSVWTVPTRGFGEAHFATFPPELIEPCILAGCPRGGVTLDPFGGAGTTGLVAERHGRDSILIELNPEYARMARDRIKAESPLFAEVA